MKRSKENFSRIRIESVLGIQGVHPSENVRAKKVGRFLSYLVNTSLVLMVLNLLLLWVSPKYAQNLDWVDHWIWFIFTLEFFVSIFLVDHRWRYLRNNWLNLSIVILAVPFIKWDADAFMIIRALRLVLFIRVIFSLFSILAQVLTKNSFGKFLLVAVGFMIASAMIFSYIESIDFADALWYALVTITTVGYGDIVPQTEHGREFAALMIMFGVVVFSIVTANVSAFLVGEEQKRTERDILNYVKQVYNRMMAQEEKNEIHIERILNHVTHKVDYLERRLKNFTQEQRTQGLDNESQAFEHLSCEQLQTRLNQIEEKMAQIENFQQSEMVQKLESIEQKLAQLRKDER